MDQRRIGRRAEREALADLHRSHTFKIKILTHWVIDAAHVI
jgi:hypothetical protein